MGNDKTKPFTEQGVKQIYLSIFLVIPFCLVTFLTAFIHIAAGGATFVICIMILLIFFLKGVGDMLSGREELGEKHTQNVVLATILSSVSVIVFLFLIVSFLVLSGFFSSSSTGISLDLYGTYITSIGLPFAIFLVFRIIIGLALIYYIEVILPEKKKLLWQSFYAFVLFPFVLLIPINAYVLYGLSLLSFILPVLLYYQCYKFAHQKLCCSEIKAVPLIPCPYCNVMIPMESISCKHCGTKFKKRSREFEIDPRLTIDSPKQEFDLPKGYTPVKGPSDEQKKRLLNLILFIIALIVTITVIAFAFQILTSGNTDTNIPQDQFIGTWQGGMFDGESSYGTNEKWVFYANNSLKEEDDFGVTWYSFYVESANSLCKEDDSISFTMCYTYDFTNNGNTLS
ncbi:MAG: hypothetical protein ACXAAH_16410, partial [Promethearchaeota archaeon]